MKGPLKLVWDGCRRSDVDEATAARNAEARALIEAWLDAAFAGPADAVEDLVRRVTAALEARKR